MPGSDLFLDYSGIVDYITIDRILTGFKKSTDFTSLDKTTGKRVYGVLSECLENIQKYSALSATDSRGMPPRIKARKLNNKILIEAGNTIASATKDKLEKILDKVNHLDEIALKKSYETIIVSGPDLGEKGAGLGLIYMALRSGNRIEYRFKHLTEGYLYFEIQISINKYLMRKLIIDQTSFTPKVIFDPEKKIFQISGESRPPDVREFYDKVLSWLNEFRLHITASDQKKDPIVFSFNFEYFNSSSAKLILDMCKVLASLSQKEVNITIEWCYEKEDIDMLEVGKEMSRIVKFPFKYVES
jgi:hypothetical protein